MFTSRAEYAIIYIYGYNLKPQRRILYDPSGPEPGSANEGVPCSDKSEALRLLPLSIFTKEMKSNVQNLQHPEA